MDPKILENNKKLKKNVENLEILKEIEENRDYFEFCGKNEGKTRLKEHVLVILSV